MKSLSSIVEKVAARPLPPAKLNGHLELARGYGFRASRQDGQIIVEQDAEDGTAIVVFNAHELQRLIEWAQEGP